jgi:hypothetical protein
MAESAGMTFSARCPVPGECERKVFIADSPGAALLLVKEHLKANLADPDHSDIAELEEWL